MKHFIISHVLIAVLAMTMAASEPSYSYVEGGGAWMDSGEQAQQDYYYGEDYYRNSEDEESFENLKLGNEDDSNDSDEDLVADAVKDYMDDYSLSGKDGKSPWRGDMIIYQ